MTMEDYCNTGNSSLKKCVTTCSCGYLSCFDHLSTLADGWRLSLLLIDGLAGFGREKVCSSTYRVVTVLILGCECYVPW
jgi:hypothetical protein